MSVTVLTDKAAFDAAIKGTDKLVVVDFYADWCGPCRMIAPKLEEFAALYAEKIIVYKVNVDSNAETSEACGVTAMPTFQYYKDGDKVHEVVGASEEKIKAGILQHY